MLSRSLMGMNLSKFPTDKWTLITFDLIQFISSPLTCSTTSGKLALIYFTKFYWFTWKFTINIRPFIIDLSIKFKAIGRHQNVAEIYAAISFREKSYLIVFVPPRFRRLSSRRQCQWQRHHHHHQRRQSRKTFGLTFGIASRQSRRIGWRRSISKRSEEHQTGSTYSPKIKCVCINGSVTGWPDCSLNISSFATSWQSRRLKYQRSVVQIQSLAIFILKLCLLSTALKERK